MQEESDLPSMLSLHIETVQVGDSSAVDRDCQLATAASTHFAIYFVRNQESARFLADR